MRALIWIVEDTWEATVDAAEALLPLDADVTLLHVAGTEAEAAAGGARAGLLGRRPRHGPAHPEPEPLRAISEEAAAALLDEAAARFGGGVKVVARRGRIEREVVDAANGFDVLVLARDGERDRLGPRSLGPATRFVVDHAPSAVLLVWPDGGPGVQTIPPPPR